jgi:hypothetical protein
MSWALVLSSKEGLLPLASITPLLRLSFVTWACVAFRCCAYSLVPLPLQVRLSTTIPIDMYSTFFKHIKGNSIAQSRLVNVQSPETQWMPSVRTWWFVQRVTIFNGQLIGSGSKGKSSCLLSLIRRSQRVGGFYIAYRCMEGVIARRDFYVRTIRWDVTWRAHCDEATREELALAIWQYCSDVLNWNVAF